MRVYLDTCCPNRPFEDQSQDRVRRETEAIAFILRRIVAGDWIWVGSEPLEVETNAVRDPTHRDAVQVLLQNMRQFVPLTPSVMRRAEVLDGFNIKPFDAQHIACAEAGRAGVFLTTDDRLLAAASRARPLVGIPVVNPRQWLEEVMPW